MSKIFILLLVASSLLACGGNIKESNCTGNNWASVGYDTAKKGKSIRSFDEYTKACGANLSAGAKDAYIDGYTKGIIEYCTYDNGYKIGSANATIPDVCPYELRAEFIKGYKQGNLEVSEKLRVMKDGSEKTRGTKFDKPGSGDSPKNIPL